MNGAFIGLFGNFHHCGCVYSHLFRIGFTLINQDPVILIVDGHYTHTWNVIYSARKNTAVVYTSNGCSVYEPLKT